ncbi:MAG: aminotransferase class I/II-fold pyridoxal phosphate-dependent enzyme, partial [Planctomycetota bacterium]
AGLRIGYAAGPSAVINAMRAAGGPFPCSAVSLAAAEAALDLPDDVISARIDQVRRERASMTSLLRSSGVEVLPSEANFVLARLEHAGRVWERLAERGVRVKRFADPVLDRFLRIGCPGDSRAYKQLIAALNECLTEQGARP